MFAFKVCGSLENQRIAFCRKSSEETTSRLEAGRLQLRKLGVSRRAAQEIRNQSVRCLCASLLLSFLACFIASFFASLLGSCFVVSLFFVCVLCFFACFFFGLDCLCFLCFFASFFASLLACLFRSLIVFCLFVSFVSLLVFSLAWIACVFFAS